MLPDVEMAKLPQKDFSVRQAFGLRVNPKMKITGYADNHELSHLVGRVNPQHCWGPLLQDIDKWYRKEPDPLMIFGHRGTGKSSSLRQYCAVLNIPTRVVCGHGELEKSDLVGGWKLVNGNMTFCYGPLALAMMEGCVLVIEELDRCPPAVLVALNAILEGDDLTIDENGGEIVKPASGFRIAATANTRGDGGASTKGDYNSANRLDASTKDRFMWVEAEYLEPAIEESVLRRMYKLPDVVAKSMVEVANMTRKAYAADELGLVMSTRTLIRWARQSIMHNSKPDHFVYAMNRAIGFSAQDEDRQLICEYLQACGLDTSGNPSTTEEAAA